jgi:hypothetical protein
MGALLFRCPQTAHIIDSQVETDDQGVRPARDLAMRVYCPHCKEWHDMPLSAAVIDGHAA